MPPEEQTRVNAVDQGAGRGVMVPITRGQLKEIGIDPDEPITVNRHAFGSSSDPTIRLRLYNED